MSQLNSYDLSRTIGQHFKVSMESEQEIEISTDTVVINQDLTVAADVEAVAEDNAQLVEVDSQIDDVNEASATLESLIASMESSILRGGFDKTNALLANIALESVATRFDFDVTMLSFGMEAVNEDAEAATKSTMSKAKEMLGVLKSNAGALISKIYRVAASALGNNAQLSATIIAEATKLKSKIDNSNKGGEILHLNTTIGRKLSLGDMKPLSPDNYVREFKRVVDKYNSVVKTYADTNALSAFVNDVVKGMGGSDAQPASTKAIMTAVNNLSEGVNIAVKSDGATEVKQSAPYLGGIAIKTTRPSLKTVEEALSNAVKKNQVSQEGLANFLGGMVQVVVGGAIFTMGFMGMVGGTVMTAMVLSSVPLAMAGVALATLSFFGARAGAQMIVNGFDQQTEQVGKAIDAASGKMSFAKKFTAIANTDFAVSMPGFGNEDADSKVFKTHSLSPKQITDVATIVENTAATTATMKAELNKRKALIKQIDALTKELAKDKENNAPLQKAAAAFVKQFIRQTIKFEMEMTSYALYVMKSGLTYAMVSNSSLAREASKSVEEGTPL